MPEYLSPGVYVEEIELGPRPIEGVSTSTAGMVGAALRGPVDGPPVLVTSYPDFVRRFGGVLGAEWGDSRFLAPAVRGFFENGGQRVYIARVVDEASAVHARLTLGNAITTRLAFDALGGDQLSLVSLRGVQVGATLTLRDEAGVIADTPVDVSAYNPQTGEVTLSADLEHTFRASQTIVIVRAPAADDFFRVEARDPGGWGDALEVRLRSTQPFRAFVEAPEQHAVRPTPRTITAVGGPSRVTLDSVEDLEPNDPIELEAPNGGRVRRRRVQQIDGDEVILNTPLDDEAAFEGGQARGLVVVRADEDWTDPPEAIANLDDGTRIRVLGPGLAIDGTVQGGDAVLGDHPPILAGAAIFAMDLAGPHDDLHLNNTGGLYAGALVEIDTGSAKDYRTVAEVTADGIVLDDACPLELAVGHTVRLCEISLVVRYRDPSVGVDRVETFDRLSVNPAVEDRWLPAVVNAQSTLVRIATLGAPPLSGAAFANPATTTGGWTHLAGGGDGDPPTLADYVGRDLGAGDRTGIQALADIDQISIVAAPGRSEQFVQNALIAHCELLKDRFAVLDPPSNAGLQDVQDHRSLYDTRYAALYYPWLRTRDRAGELTVPPSGHIAGIYARVDVERGVHKAPANEVIRGILDVARRVNKREQDILNPSPVNINVIRDFRARGRGIRVWGARCMTSDTPWTYINVRRLFIFLEESIEEGTQWAVFEPNDEPLWARLRQTVSNFLKRVWRDGALQGSTPEQAFYIKCDRTTMTQDDIDNGRLIMEIGVAPVRPAEFVVIRIGQWTGGTDIQET